MGEVYIWPGVLALSSFWLAVVQLSMSQASEHEGEPGMKEATLAGFFTHMHTPTYHDQGIVLTILSIYLSI